MKPACHICDSEGESFLPWPEGGGEMRLCRDCDYVFAWPVVNVDPVDLYSQAYLGLDSRAVMDEYAVRLERRSIVARREKIGLWSPAHHYALQWLEEHVPKGSTVLEVGCGLGAVMRALRQRAYNAVGLDVAKPVVDALKREGFQVRCGTVETTPKAWVQPEPAAIVSFFVLHHLSDPVAFLRAVRSRWPAPLIIGYNVSPTKRSAQAHNFPPRTWGWWTARAIERALKLANYSVVEIVREPKTIAALSLPTRLRRITSLALWRWPWLRSMAGHVVDAILALTFRLLNPVPVLSRRLEGSLLIIALPSQTETEQQL